MRSRLYNPTIGKAAVSSSVTNGGATSATPGPVSSLLSSIPLTRLSSETVQRIASKRLSSAGATLASSPGDTNPQFDSSATQQNESTPSVADFFNPGEAGKDTIRMFNGRSFLSLPSTRIFKLVPCSKPSGNVATQTERLKKTKKNFDCAECPRKCRDNFDLVKHIDAMHTPLWYEQGGLECDMWFCDVQLPTKHEWKLHMDSCWWVCGEPDCTFQAHRQPGVFITFSSGSIVSSFAWWPLGFDFLIL